VARIKGVVFVNRYDYLMSTAGEAGLAKVMAKLSADDAKALNLPNASEWYPLETVLRVDQVILDEVLGGNLERMIEVGAFSWRQNLNVTYRFLFRILSTETILSQASGAFRKMLDTGTASVEKLAPRDVIVRYEGFHPVKESYCRVLKGSLVGIMDACRVKGTVTDHACVFKGDPCCAFRARWE
jgi:hypothetical protein